MQDMSKILAKAENSSKGSDVYFYAPKGTYIAKNQRGSWIPRNDAKIKRYLIGLGKRKKAEKGEAMSEVDQCLLNIEELNDVQYVGALAGAMEGMCEDGVLRVLVTHSPKIIKPVEGDWRVLEQLLNGMFCEKQRTYLFGWLSLAYQSLTMGARTQGQALAIAGKAGSGKSLFQNLITHILGGRSAKPYQFMTGASTFNSDLFGAEHLMIEDETAATDLRSRRNMGQLIKNFTVCADQRCHGKGVDAITLHPFWRLTLTMNDEPENLMVLPPIDESLADKIIMLKACKKPMPMPTGSIQEKITFWDRLIADLPAFIHYLVNFEIPQELKCDRYGITHYHHDDIMAEISAMAPETRLLAMIVAVIEDECWEGTSMELSAVLSCNESAYANEARHLLSWANSTGTYLGRLAEKYPENIIYNKTNQLRYWRIIQPIK